MTGLQSKYPCYERGRIAEAASSLGHNNIKDIERDSGDC